MSANENNRADVGRVPSRGASLPPPNAASGDAAYNKPRAADVGRVPSHGVPVPPADERPPRRLRRLHRVWPTATGTFPIF